MKKILLIIIIFFSFLSLFFSCDDSTGPPNNNAQINLTLEDVSCTEAWLKLETENIDLPAQINLLVDDKLKSNYSISSSDTILYVDSLLPNKTYNFQSIIQSNNQNEIKSNELSVTTMDTTSHNFTFETFTFGQHSSSVLYDVAIIDENNIWAVGEIYADTTGLPFNAVHWDGSSWELKRIQTEFRGNIITVPIEGILTFSSTDIWMVGSLPIHGDGTNWTMYDIRTTVDPNLSLSKAWGSSTNDIYFVGRNGSIAHYQNGVWSKVESGTDGNIRDIWGFKDQYSNSLKILSAMFSQSGSKILSISQNTAKDTLNWMTTKGLGSVWFDRFHLFASGSGIWRYKNNSWSKMNYLSEYFLSTIRGDKINNLFAIGWLENVIHFNGVNWQKLTNVPSGTNFEGIAIKDGKVVLVGFISSGGVVGAAVICVATAQ